MQSNPFSSESDDLPGAGESIEINPIVQAPKKTRAVIHFSTQRWLQLVKQGNTRQLSRLYKWISKQEHASSVFDMIGVATVQSTFDSMSSPIVKKGLVGAQSIPLFLPTIACIFLWTIWTYEFSTRTQTPLKANETNLIHVMTRLSSFLNRINLHKGARLPKQYRNLARSSWNRILSRFARVADGSRDFVYVWSNLCIVAKYLDILCLKRPEKAHFTKQLMTLLTRDRAMDLLVAIVNIEKNQDEPCALSKRYVVRDELLSTQKHDVDAMSLVPIVMLVVEKIHYSVEDAEDFVQSYLDSWVKFNEATSLSTEQSIDALTASVESLVQLGCCTQAVELVRRIDQALGVWIPDQLKPKKISESAQRVLLFNTNHSFERYIHRLRTAAIPPEPKTTLARANARQVNWFQPVSQYPVSRDDVLPYVDCYAWLAMNTAGPDFLPEKLRHYLTNLSVWCASPNGPRIVSDDVLVQEIKELFTRKWIRAHDGLSFESYWNVYSLSSQASRVFDVCIPNWTSMYKDACLRVWPRVWNDLVDALVPEEFKPGFRDQLDPEMAMIMQEFLHSQIDLKIKSDITMVFDFIEWSLTSGIFSKLPAWVYLYQSVFKRGAPMYIPCEIEGSNRPLILHWVRKLSDKQLLSWALGIRAMQLLRGNTFYLPVEIARAVLEEISQRPSKSVANAWLQRRASVLGQ